MSKAKKAKAAAVEEVERCEDQGAENPVRGRELFQLLSEPKPVPLEVVERLVEADPVCVRRRFAMNAYGSDGHFDGSGHGEDPEGSVSPLWMACSNGHAKVLQFLIDSGGDVNDYFNIDCCVVSAASAAADDGHLECLKVLHRNGANFKKCYVLDQGGLATMAAYNGDVEMLDYLTSIGIGPVDEYTLDFRSRMYRRGQQSRVVPPLLREAIEKNIQATNKD
jgi:ankyrin repeat protein